MQIVIISDVKNLGGAAIAASRLATGFQRLGHQVSWIISRNRERSSTAEVREVRVRDRYRRAAEIIPTAGRADLPLRPFIGRSLERQLEELQPDVINLHNLHGAFGGGWSVRMAAVADSFAPTLWTLHDMWSFTGRCAYSHDCTKYIGGCDAACPTPREYPALNPSRIAGEWELRREVLAGLGRTSAVSPSDWLAQRAREGLWSCRHVEVVPHGLPLDVYRPLPQLAARRSLGLEGNRPVVLTAAANLGERRKGMDLLEAALELLPYPVTLLTLGHGTLRVRSDHPQVNLGHVSNDRLKAAVYSAADLLVHPSRADVFGLVVQESIACGTPVVAFPVGGLPELVLSDRTGWLADEITGEALSVQLEHALDNHASLRESCRAHAEREWPLDQQASQYVDFARNLGTTSESAAPVDRT